jgi:hypothetical protein
VSKAGGRLRLGPLPKSDTVNLTVALSAELKTTLDQYAELHVRTWGEPVDAAALVPHMLIAFMDRDREFKAIRRRSPTPGMLGPTLSVGAPPGEEASAVARGG